MSPAGSSSARGLFLVLTVLAAAGTGGFLVHRFTGPRPTVYADPAPRSSDALIPTPDPAVAANSRKIPEDIPQISLPGLDGKRHALRDYGGKLLVVNFWATWCEPCRREIPLLKSLRAEYAKNGLEIVGIAVDSRDDVAKYVSTHGIVYPVLLGEQGGLEAASAFGMDVVLPFSVFADRAGHIVALKVGELRPEEAHAILAGLRALDEGHLSLKAAQAQIGASMEEISARHAAQGATGGN